MRRIRWMAVGQTIPWRAAAMAGLALLGAHLALAGFPVADSAEALTALVAKAQPGDTVALKDGVYFDARLEIKATGTPDKPVTIRPETPGGVTLKGNTHVVVSGTGMALSGFRFNNCQDAVVVFKGKRNRLTECEFESCGSLLSTFSHIVRVELGADENRVDHCTFSRSRSMSVGVNDGWYGGRKELGVIATGTRIDHNVFRDIHRFWINGQEAIQLGQGQKPKARAEATIEHNLFDDASGDTEIFSLKTGGNTVRHNVAVNCRGSFYFRCGDETRMEGNVLIGCDRGFTVMGERHTIVNNLVIGAREEGIYLPTGGGAARSNTFPTIGTLIAHNTIVDCADGGIVFSGTPGQKEAGGTFVQKRTRVLNNIVAGERGLLMNPGALQNGEIRGNLFHAHGDARLGEKGVGAILADPGLQGKGVAMHATSGEAVGAKIAEVKTDRWGKVRPGERVTLGADELATWQGVSGLPDPDRYPAAPAIRHRFVPEAYEDEELSAFPGAGPLIGMEHDAGYRNQGGHAVLADGSVWAEGLPDSFVLTWDYLPGAYASVARLRFGADARGKGGYVLEWGGLGKDGLASGVVKIYKAGVEQPVAWGPDTLYFHMNMVPSYPDGKPKIPNKTPIEGRWYRFVLAKNGGRIRVMLNNVSLRPTGYAGDWHRFADVKQKAGRSLILDWEDVGRVGGEARSGSVVEVVQQGEAKWRNLRAWRYGYVGDRVPMPPRGARATVQAANCVRLAWSDYEGGLPGTVMEVHRGASAGFEPTDATALVKQTQNTRLTDVGLAPGKTVWYKLRRVSPYGVASPWVEVSATPKDTGRRLLVIEAESADELTAPYRVFAQGGDGQTYISAPGAPRALEKAPEGVHAFYRVDIPEAGAYRLWAREIAPNGGSDSFRYRVGESGAWRTTGARVCQSWTWSPAGSGTLSFEKGEQVLAITYREPNLKIDKFLLTSDREFRP